MSGSKSAMVTESVFERAKEVFLQYAEPLGLGERCPGQSLPERLVVPDKSVTFRLCRFMSFSCSRSGNTSLALRRPFIRPRVSKRTFEFSRSQRLTCDQ